MPPAVTSDAPRMNGAVSLLASTGPSTSWRTELLSNNHDISHSELMMTTDSAAVVTHVVT